MRTENLNLQQKGWLMIAIPLAFQILLMLSLGGLITQSFRDQEQAFWRRDTMEEADGMIRTCVQGLLAVMSYGMTKDRAKAEEFEEVKNGLGTRIQKLQGLTQGDATYMRRLNMAKAQVTSFFNLMAEAKDQLDKGKRNPLAYMGFLKKQTLLVTSFKDLRNLQKELNDPLLMEEHRLRKTHIRDHKLILTLLGFGAVICVLLAGAAARFFAQEIVQRLNIISRNSERLKQNEELLPVQPGTDEVSILDKEFHNMAQRLEEARSSLREIINNSEDVICSLSGDGIFTFVSETVRRAWAVSPAELTGRSLFDVISEDRTATSSFFKDLKANSLSRPITLTLNCGNRRLDTSWSVHWSPSDASFFCVVHDVSDKKQRELFKQRFVNLISIQLGTPLKGLERRIESLAETQEITSPRGLTAIKNARLSVQRIGGLVTELLELDKMSEGVLSLNLAETSTPEIVQSAVASLASMAEFKKVAMVTDVPDTTLVADGKRLTQVLVNLLSNALKYSPKNTTVTIGVKEEDGDFTFSISDEGPGIPESAINSLFSKFKRLDREVDRQQKGTGLGLSICKGIVEQHKGSIGVENLPERGARFWFRIPGSSAPEKTA